MNVGDIFQWKSQCELLCFDFVTRTKLWGVNREKEKTHAKFHNIFSFSLFSLAWFVQNEIELKKFAPWFLLKKIGRQTLISSDTILSPHNSLVKFYNLVFILLYKVNKPGANFFFCILYIQILKSIRKNFVKYASKFKIWTFKTQ